MVFDWFPWFFKVVRWFFMVFGWFRWFFKVVSWFFEVFAWFPWFFKVVSWFLLGFHGFSRWFHGFSWFLVGSPREWRKVCVTKNEHFLKRLGLQKELINIQLPVAGHIASVSWFPTSPWHSGHCWYTGHSGDVGHSWDTGHCGHCGHCVSSDPTGLEAGWIISHSSKALPMLA